MDNNEIKYEFKSVDHTTVENKDNEIKRIGKIVSVSSLKVEIFLENECDLSIRDLVYVISNNNRIYFEIAEITQNTVAAICFTMTNGLTRGLDVYVQEGGIQVAYDDGILGHVFNPYGSLIAGDKFEHVQKTRNIYDKSLSMSEIDINGDILWTGIKVLDFFSPMRKGFKMGLLGGAGVGKTVLIKELINNVYR